MALGMQLGRVTGRCWWDFPNLLAVLAVVVGLIQAWPTSAGEASYVLSRGQKYPLCREYLDNIRSLGLLNTVTFEWPVSQESRNLRKPKWQPIDAKDRLDIVEKIYRARRDGTLGPNPLSDDDTARAWERIRPAVLDEIASGVARLEQARVDFNNDGRAEQAFRYGRKVYSIGEKPVSATGEHTLWGYWYWFKGDAEALEEAWQPYSSLSLIHDMFFYKGRTYYSTYSTNTFRVGKLPDHVIYEPQATRGGLELSMTPICLFSHSE
jgi:hypothetical protein